MPRKTHSQQSLLTEIKNNSENEISSLVHRFNNRLTSDNLRIAERYIKTELHVLIHFRLGNDAEYAASFQYAGDRDGQKERHKYL
jgi:hypothetical protein